MRIIVRTGLAIAMISCPSCRHEQPAQPAPSPALASVATATTQSATTQSAVPEPSASNVALRPTMGLALLLKLQQDYLASEGPAHRGPEFSKLLAGLQMSVPSYHGFIPIGEKTREEPITEFEMLALLGPPDYAEADWRGAEYVYLYTSKGRREAVSIQVGSRGFVDRIGYNSASAMGLERARPYRPLIRFSNEVPASTLPADGGYLGVNVDAVKWWQDGHWYLGAHGAQVYFVADGSPAARAGIVKGDVIERIGDKRAEAEGFHEQVSRLKPGEKVELTVRREGGMAPTDQRVVTVTVGARPQPATRASEAR
jgi:hypothetical protein